MYQWARGRRRGFPGDSPLLTQRNLRRHEGREPGSRCSALSAEVRFLSGAGQACGPLPPCTGSGSANSVVCVGGAGGRSTSGGVLSPRLSCPSCFGAQGVCRVQ